MAEKISPSVDHQDNSHERQKTGLLPDKTGDTNYYLFEQVNKL